MYESVSGLSPGVQGELLSALGCILELRPQLFAPDAGLVNAFSGQWLLEEANRLVQAPATAAALKTGALAGLCSAMSACEARPSLALNPNSQDLERRRTQRDRPLRMTTTISLPSD